ncbi:hypothetical protein SAMN04487761_12620 [Lachnospiraceae bacterium C7]|nr:hypothetical protein SAMN04487761_12620 [Lachnospiraceae bacterium C7]
MKIWFKFIKDARIENSETIEDYSTETRTHKILNSVDEICYKFDLSKPIWLESNIDEFKRRSKTRFSSDNFVDEIEFDYMEMEVLEEDY